jgi:hypothetical protein
MPTTEAQKRATNKYREKNKDLTNQQSNNYVKKMWAIRRENGDPKHAELLQYTKNYNDWKYFLHNNSFLKESRLFLQILI